MLEWTTSGDGVRFGLLVHHDDADREFAYDRNSHVGKLARGLDEARKRGWVVVSMKRDWKEVLPDNSVTAIDVLLEPDQTMLDHAAAVNARLLKEFPTGFPLDAQHRPHITLLQRFVRTADLEKVYAATEKVLAGFDLKRMKLEAFKHYYIPDGATGLAGLVVKPTPELIELQGKVIAAVAPFTVETGESNAFVTTPDDLIINPALIAYVSAFVPKGTDENFNPYVTTGVGPREYLDKMLKEPFETFTFSPARAAVYQLGQFGTAAKKLKEWP